jgi:ABC-type multidrug transport system fused ATPase/permease subunit
LRAEVTLRTQKTLEQAELGVVDNVNDAVINYRVVCDYYRRPKVAKEIAINVVEFNSAFNDCAAVRTSNEWCPKWIALITHVISLVLGGALLIQEAIPLKLGTFLALLHMIKSSGENYKDLYKTFLSMSDAYLPMWRIVRFLNQPEDVPKRKAANRKRRKRGEEERTKVREAMSKEELKKGIPVVDLLPIRIDDLSFQFDNAEKHVLDSITAELKQGTIVTIIGAPASGKGVFLEVLGSVYQYEVGDIFVPPHLRVLHVSRHPMVLNGSVADNIFFGVSPDGIKGLDRAQIQRGLKICKRLKFPKRLMELINASLEAGESKKDEDNSALQLSGMLSRSDRKLIHLARALIYNPEVLVIHTPGMYFDDEHRRLVVEMLSDYVRNRGVEMDEKKKMERRMRTCIFTSDDRSHIGMADQILLCENGTLNSMTEGKARRTLNTFQGMDMPRSSNQDMNGETVILEAPTDAESKLPIMQYSIAIYYAEKDEGNMKIDICKLGDPYAKCSVSYKTDPSPYEGVKFKHVEGRLTFEPGQPTLSIFVPIIDTHGFDSSREFSLSLSDPDGCTLGLYLKNCRVKIVERSMFPTAKFGSVKDPISQEEASDTKMAQMRRKVSFGMLREVSTFLLAHAPNAKKLVLLHQLENAYTVWIVHVMQSLVDYLEGLEPGPNPWATMTFYGLCFILPCPVLHYFDFQKNYWGVAGSARSVLMENLMSKYLNYEEHLRSAFSPAQFIHCVIQDVPELVKSGFMGMFTLFNHCGIFVMLSAYAIFLFSQSDDAVYIIYVMVANTVCYLSIMGIFLIFMGETTGTKQKLQEEMESALINHVGDCVTHYRVIADYYRRPMVASKIAKAIDVYNRAVISVGQTRTNSEWVPKWIAAFISANLIYQGGNLVANRQLGVGTYFALLRITVITGDAFTEAYKAYLVMYDAFLPMWRIRRFINTPTDLAKRKAANRIRRKRGEEMRTATREMMKKEDLQKGVPVVDLLPIRLEDVGFKFGQDDYLFRHISRDIKQGTLVGVMGPPASGKGTFLELLGGVHEQQDGSIFVPPHLRVLHVSRHSQVLKGSIAENLFFGIIGPGQGVEDLDESMLKRGWKICERLKFPKRLMNLAMQMPIKKRNSQMNMHTRTTTAVQSKSLYGALSRSDSKLIHLARALIYNPEVLIVHTPGMYFDKESKTTIISLLMEFVRMRGVEMDPATRLRRRPRTCIFSTYDMGDIMYADEMLQCQNGTLVHQMNLLAQLTRSDVEHLAQKKPRY